MLQNVREAYSTWIYSFWWIQARSHREITSSLNFPFNNAPRPSSSLQFQIITEGKSIVSWMNVHKKTLLHTRVFQHWTFTMKIASFSVSCHYCVCHWKNNNMKFLSMPRARWMEEISKTSTLISSGNSHSERFCFACLAILICFGNSWDFPRFAVVDSARKHETRECPTKMAQLPSEGHLKLLPLLIHILRSSVT